VNNLTGVGLTKYYVHQGIHRVDDVFQEYFDRVSTSSSVIKFKKMLFERFEAWIPLDQMVLIKSGRTLDDSDVLSETEGSNYSTMTLQCKTAKNFYVQGGYEFGSINLDFEDATTILSIKQQIQKEKNIAVEKQILIARSNIFTMNDVPCDGRVLEGADVVFRCVGGKLNAKQTESLSDGNRNYIKFSKFAVVFLLEADTVTTSKQSWNRSRLFLVGKER
jgi:hypothetical protein